MTRAFACMAALVSLGVIVEASARADVVTGFALPTRRAATDGAQQLSDQAARVARVVGHEVAPELPLSSERTLDVGARVTHARDAFVAGQLDAAANELDKVLDESLIEPSALRDPQDVLQALVTRAAIGLARNEGERVGEVLDRALRFEPGLELTPAERSPALRAALERARQRVGAHPEIRAADLGKSCDSARVLIVARVLDEHTVELSRFDRCRFVAAALLSGAIDEQSAATLLAHAGSSRSAPASAVATQPPPREHSYHRGWIFGVVGGVGLVIAVTGAALAGSTVPEYNKLTTMCGGGTCAPSLARPYEQRADAGWALIAGLVDRHRHAQ